jgi:2,4-didehydro-3-deoxy-L-rhamnonate hydrolase
MRLIRFGAPGEERPGLVDQAGVLRDVSAHVEDWNGTSLQPDSLARIRSLRPGDLPEVAQTGRLGVPVAGAGKVVCVGLNYADHAREAGLTPPSEPIWFLKATSALSGPNDPVVIPRGALKMDWEVELAVVIGSRASNVTEHAAHSCIAGYAVFHDVSERAFQLERGTQWAKGKSRDTFAPLGPWLVTAEDIPEPDELDRRYGRTRYSGLETTAAAARVRQLARAAQVQIRQVVHRRAYARR